MTNKISLLILLTLSGCASAPQYHCEQEGHYRNIQYCTPDLNTDKAVCINCPDWINNGKWDCIPMEGD